MSKKSMSAYKEPLLLRFHGLRLVGLNDTKILDKSLKWPKVQSYMVVLKSFYMR